MDKVIVNGIGLSGGGLILLENYLKSSENENVVFIVFSEKKLRQTKNSKIIIRKYFKSSFGRLYFILFGFTKSKAPTQTNDLFSESFRK